MHLLNANSFMQLFFKADKNFNPCIVLRLLDLHITHITSNRYGESMIGFEIGKKEDRKGNGDMTTLADFLKVRRLN